MNVAIVLLSSRGTSNDVGLCNSLAFLHSMGLVPIVVLSDEVNDVDRVEGTGAAISSKFDAESVPLTFGTLPLLPRTLLVLSGAYYSVDYNREFERGESGVTEKA